jgi:hypothetical protein
VSEAKQDAQQSQALFAKLGIGLWTITEKSLADGTQCYNRGSKVTAGVGCLRLAKKKEPAARLGPSAKSKAADRN